MSGDDSTDMELPPRPPVQHPVRPMLAGNPKGDDRPKPPDSASEHPSWTLDPKASSQVRGDAEPLLDVDPSRNRDLSALEGNERPILAGNPKGSAAAGRNMLVIVVVLVTGALVALWTSGVLG